MHRIFSVAQVALLLCAVLGHCNPLRIQETWSHAAQKFYGQRVDPVIASSSRASADGGVVAMVYVDAIHGYNLTNGTLLWRLPVDASTDSTPWSCATTFDGVAFICRSFWARWWVRLDARTGRPEWHTDWGSGASNTIPFRAGPYFLYTTRTGDGFHPTVRLIAYSQQTGQKLYDVSHASQLFDYKAAYDAASGTIVLGCGVGMYSRYPSYCGVRAADGALLWVYNASRAIYNGTAVQLGAPVTLGDGRVFGRVVEYVNPNGYVRGHFVLLDAASGKVLRVTVPPLDLYMSTLAFGAGLLFYQSAAGDSNVVVAIDAATGDVAWQQSLAACGGGCSDFAYADLRLFCGGCVVAWSQGSTRTVTPFNYNVDVVATNPTGTRLAIVNPPNSPTGTPQLIGFNVTQP